MAAHTHARFGGFVSPLRYRQTTVGICNIDAFFLPLLRFYLLLAAARFW